MSASSSNGVKNGLFGYLKGLFRRGDDSTEMNSGEETPDYNAEAMPLVAPPVEVALAAAPAPVSRANANVDTLGGGPVPSIAIPFQPVLNGLPQELRERVRVQTVGDLMIHVALDKVLSQLAQGQVRIPFGDIRKAAPEVFTASTDFDRISVALPLNEILCRINPGLLGRRTAARQIEIPEEIASPFAGKGEGLSLSVGNVKPVQPAAPKKAAPAPQASGRGSISSVATPTPPAGMSNIPAPFQFAPQKPAALPATPPPAAAPIAPIPFGNLTPPPARPTPRPAPAPTFVPPQPYAQPQPAAPRAPQPAPQPVAAPKPPVTCQAVITTPLHTLSEAWPESLRLEILQTNLNEARIALPVETVEAALKRGRVMFSWKTIRSWISPATATNVSVHDSAELELPLKVIAPLFLARKRSGAGAPQKIAVDEAIPNLFFGFPQPEAPAPVAVQTPTVGFQPQALPQQQVAPEVRPMYSSAGASAAAASSAAASAAVAAAAAAASAQAAAAKPVDTNYYLWDDVSDTQMFHIEALKQKGTSATEFVKRYSSPNEIVSRAAALDGVAGVLIALPDGLMVASRIPAELNGDTLAAFLPQIFAKVSACTKELRMGELNNVSFTVGNVPWKIFRVNAIFFAAFGTAAQPMPTAELAGLAAQLDRKNK